MTRKATKNKRAGRIFLLFLAIALVAFFFIFIFPQLNKSRKPVKKNIPVQEQNNPVFRKDGRLAFLEPGGNSIVSVIDIEIADNDEERTRGLMYRKSMADSCGMLFIMDQTETQSFWMKNTYLPLDIIFVDENFTIVSIGRDTKPLSLESVTSLKPAKYVVEVNAGYTEKYGIEAGFLIKVQ